MSVEIYSECRIQFDSSTNKSINFDRCLIELRQYDIGDYNLRAINLNNRKFEIFNWPLTHRNQYVFALSIEQPDILNGKNEICRIWLNRNLRDKFHKILRTCLEEFLIVKDNDTNYSSQLNNEEKSRKFLHELSTEDDKPYYRNDEPFECITCFDTIEKNEGILFRNCLHSLCKPCLLRLIETNTEPIVKCPHDGCTALLEERELRGVVSDLNADQKIIDRLHDVGMRFAESRNKTFHCITPDCTHWWFIEPEHANDIIFCNGCKHWICLACSVIHEGQTCSEYQDMKKLKEANDSTVRQDIEHLELMIKNKEAMYCPGCRVIIQKAAGCDWIQCTQCKIEICWPTQGPRWGPKGRGDTSGGCRCRVDNGKLCVPNCQNCH
ncbi:unnamed protein product [Adineta steineri]|uniref:Uncharacterized protein n=2 Tax=Adineta steineri TaxID=433720 RepID=A0A819M796_9BILA|nr:unnamed protein product [Adineta steineri]CAF3975322.1 unnamed protein product [Adineta steineri]